MLLPATSSHRGRLEQTAVPDGWKATGVIEAHDDAPTGASGFYRRAAAHAADGSTTVLIMPTALTLAAWVGSRPDVRVRRTPPPPPVSV